MTLEQLRYFQAAARLQHMGKAACQETFPTQSQHCHKKAGNGIWRPPFQTKRTRR